MLGAPLAEDIVADTTMILPIAIGSEAFRQAVADKVLQCTRLAVEFLVALPELATPTAPAVQVAQLLLRMCILPRIVYLLRSSFTDVCLDLASSFAAVVHDALEQLAGCTFDVDSLAGQQLRLPLWTGGCGYTPMRRIAPTAYLGSWMACLGHVEIAVGATLLGDEAPPSPTKTAVARAEACMQTSLAAYRLLDWRTLAQHPHARGQRLSTRPLHLQAAQAWRDAAPVQDQTRLCALSAWGASALLLTVPFDSSLALCNLDMRLCLRVWLGLDVVGSGQRCARCGANLDSQGHHAHACTGNAGIRHNRLRDVIYSLLDAAGFSVMIEQDEPLLRHRPDIRVDSGLAPALTYLEVHVIHPTAPSTDHVQNSESPEAAILHAWSAKRKWEYEPLPFRMPFRLVLCAATSYGSWHPGTRAFSNDCAQRVAESAGSSPGASHVKAALLARWISKRGIAIWRQHIAMLRRCVPTM